MSKIGEIQKEINVLMAPVKAAVTRVNVVLEGVVQAKSLCSECALLGNFEKPERIQKTYQDFLENRPEWTSIHFDLESDLRAFVDAVEGTKLPQNLSKQSVDQSLVHTFYNNFSSFFEHLSEHYAKKINAIYMEFSNEIRSGAPSPEERSAVIVAFSQLQNGFLGELEEMTDWKKIDELFTEKIEIISPDRSTPRQTEISEVVGSALRAKNLPTTLASSH